jgi:RHS repeat-associated protein
MILENLVAWTAEEADTGLESITLGFANATAATGVMIRQNNAAGFVRSITLIDTDDIEHTIWTGTDPSLDTDFDLYVRFPETSYSVKAVRMEVDTDHVEDDFEAIDAVRLLTGGTFSAVTLTGRTWTADTHTDFTFNAQGKLTEAITRRGPVVLQTVTLAYDAQDGFQNEVIRTDEIGRATRWTFDAQGRTLSETLGYGSNAAATTSVTYDTDGRITSLTDALNNTTSWTFDTQGRVLSMTDELGHTVSKTYDAEGRLSSVTDRNGRLRTFAYDAEDHLTSETWFAADGISIVDTLVYVYNTQGQLITASDASGAYSFSYDANNRISNVSNPFGVTLSFTYDANGNRISMSDSLGGVVTSAYDEWGQLTERSLSGNNLPTMRFTQTFDNLGRVTNQSRFAGNQLVASSAFMFDDNWRLTSLTHTNSTQDILAQYSWIFDAVGQLTSQSDDGVSVDYTYDAQGQLTTENNTQYDFDANGNRDNAGFIIGANNRLLSDGIWNYTYDPEGNTVSKTRITDGETWTYGWDHRNQLVSVERRDATGLLLMRAEYDYDAFGNRIEKEVDNNGDSVWDVVQRYVLDGYNPAKPTPVGNENWDVIIDLDALNQVQTRYLRGDVVDELFGRVENGVALWNLNDHLGSIRDVVDVTGAIVSSVRYDAFGNVVSETAPGLRGRYGWTGREFDSETGLQYNRARYYDATTGRWFSLDPLGFAAGDSNLYRYVGNSSVNYVDPSGLARGHGVRPPVHGKPIPIRDRDGNIIHIKPPNGWHSGTGASSGNPPTNGAVPNPLPHLTRTTWPRSQEMLEKIYTDTITQAREAGVPESVIQRIRNEQHLGKPGSLSGIEIKIGRLIEEIGRKKGVPEWLLRPSPQMSGIHQGTPPTPMLQQIQQGYGVPSRNTGITPLDRLTQSGGIVLSTPIGEEMVRVTGMLSDGTPYDDFLIDEGMDSGFAARLQGDVLSLDWHGGKGNLKPRLTQVRGLATGKTINIVKGYASDNLEKIIDGKVPGQTFDPVRWSDGLSESLGGKWTTELKSEPSGRGKKWTITSTRVPGT